MPTYTDAELTDGDYVAQVIHEHYPDFEAAGVSVTILLAAEEGGGNGYRSGSPVKWRGHRVDIKPKIVGLADRTAGLRDVVLIADAGKWADFDEATKKAAIDSALCHLELQTEKDEADGGKMVPKKDALDRPKLKWRPTDFYAAGFDIILERHGKAAPEARMIESLEEALRTRQKTFGFE